VSRDLVIAPEWLGRSGLWTLDAKGKRREADAEEVGLSEAFADRLEAWMDAFDAIYDEDNEANSAFAGEVERLAWEAEGAALAHAAEAELGSAWTITFDLSAWREKVRS